MSIDELAPYPTIDVLTAVVREYGIDPCWLLTGDYDSATHRRSIDADNQTLATALRDLSRPAVLGGVPGRLRALN